MPPTKQTKSVFCIVYVPGEGDCLEVDSLVVSPEPMSNKQWKTLIDKVNKRWNELDAMVEKKEQDGTPIPDDVPEAELAAYSSGISELVLFYHPTFRVELFAEVTAD